MLGLIRASALNYWFDLAPAHAGMIGGEPLSIYGESSFSDRSGNFTESIP
jgi:hypothetical protein